jgi:hypothetical protein
MKMGTKIVPTIGRVVLYVPGPGDHASAGNQPHAATVAFVHNDNLVNLSIVDANGMQYARTEVPLVNEGETSDTLHGFCHWMPYQIGQAAAQSGATSAQSERGLGNETIGLVPTPNTEPQTEPEKVGAGG